MKLRFIILLFIITFFTIDASAQFNNAGLDRRIGGANQFKSTKNKIKEKDFDFVKSSSENLTAELGLDGLQSAAVKNFMQDYYNSIISINAEEIPDAGKMEKMNAQKDKMEAQVLSVLNKTQIEKFNTLKEKQEKKGKKKSKNSEKKE